MCDPCKHQGRLNTTDTLPSQQHFIVLVLTVGALLILVTGLTYLALLLAPSSHDPEPRGHAWQRQEGKGV
ncbi:hypothetical protein BDN72DRAFT_848345 [Pluteus cervinus]|uniref:Uncharacterized protein n=1 Tax=Pluteus cervinus TaxID=181527 RepID=A0ACD3AAQ6_9AGAR|nr:hypothetical protein BDN72DRAFT_848345 [Pluteus cervinus]